MSKKSHINQDLNEQFKEIINEYRKELRVEINQSLEVVAEQNKQDLIDASPYDIDNTNGPHFRDCWEIKKEYNLVKYVGNSRTNKGIYETDKGIPLSNLIEYSYKGHPFIEKTTKSNEEKYYNTFVQEMSRRNNK